MLKFPPLFNQEKPKIISPEEVFEIIEDGSPAHGHVDAVLTAMKQLKFSKLLSSRRCRQRDIAMAMIVSGQ